MAVSEADISALYGLPLAEFTQARNALGKQARAEGDAEQAERIKRLQKPTVVAWTLNMLPRLRAAEVAELLAAGEQAEAAQARLLSGGGDADELHQARAQLHSAARTLAGEAGEVLVKGGQAAREQTLQRVAEALEAEAVTDAGRAGLQRGEFTEEPQAPGFDLFAQLSSSSARPLKSAPPKSVRQPRQAARRRERAEASKAAEQAVAAARRELEARRAEHRQAEAATREAEQAARAKEREAVEARRSLEEERRRVERAAAAELEAKRRLDEAKQRFGRR